jgi:hypothetical protein
MHATDKIGIEMITGSRRLKFATGTALDAGWQGSLINLEAKPSHRTTKSRIICQTSR